MFFLVEKELTYNIFLWRQLSGLLSWTLVTVALNVFNGVDVRRQLLLEEILLIIEIADFREVARFQLALFAEPQQTRLADSEQGGETIAVLIHDFGMRVRIDQVGKHGGGVAAAVLDLLHESEW